MSAAGASLRVAGGWAVALAIAACGGGGGTPAATAVTSASTSSAASASGTPQPAATATATASPSNVLPVVVDRGPHGTAFVNSPFVSVTVCRPGTEICQRVDHVLLDTGSSGLRLLASALSPGLALPAVMASADAGVAQCMQFASGTAWGSVRRADVRLAGESAPAVPVQLIDDALAPYATMPAACRDAGPAVGTLLDANGILGVGTSRLDCGAACVTGARGNLYYACGDAGCNATAAPTALQVANPVGLLARHNNGVAVVLPAVPPGGAPTLAGSLVLGIGTDGNNALAAATVLPVDARGLVATTYRGTTLDAFIDTGTNALYFPDADLPRCGSFYCPAAAVRLAATLGAANGAQREVAFTVDAPDTLRADASAASLGGVATRSFQWGLPFFYGRTVFVALADAPTPGGAGPYWAF